MRVHGFQLANGVGNIHGFDLSIMQANHLAETSLGNQIDCSHAESSGQDAIEWSRRATALDVAQHADAHVFFRAPGNSIANSIAD